MEAIPHSLISEQAEAGGDFSNSGSSIFNPLSSHANPNFDPTRPVSPANSQILRDPFPGNIIPSQLLNPAAALMVRPDLWHTGWSFGVLAALLAAEWMFRRASGLR